MGKRGNGNGSLRERSPGHWELAYYGPDGRRRFVTLKGNKTAAAKELRRLQENVERNEHVDPTKITLGEFIDTWLAAMEAAPTLANKTRKRYRELLDQYAKPALGAIKLQALTKSRLRQWHAELLTSGRANPKTLEDGTVITGLSPMTVRHAHRALYLCLQAAEEDRLIAANPGRDMKLRFAASAAPPRTVKDQALGKDQLKALLNGLKGSSLYLLATLVASTGLRRGEALGLAWRHIDFDKGALTVERAVEQTKTGGAFKAPKNETSRREIKLSDEVVALLRAERLRQAEELLKLRSRVAPAHLVFRPDLTAPEHPWGPDWISLKFLRAAEGLGFKIGLHGLRHSHASQLLSAGVPVTAVAARLGHSSVTTTLRVYAHAVDEGERQAASQAAAIMADVLN